MDVLFNGRKVASTSIAGQWTELPFKVPSHFQVAGENALWLRFETVRSGDAAAAVAEVHLGV